MTYFLMLMIITPLMCLEFVDPAIPFLAELTVKRLAGFAGGLCLHRPSDSEMLRKDRRSGMISTVDSLDRIAGFNAIGRRICKEVR